MDYGRNFFQTKDVGIYAVMMSLISALLIVPNTTISDFATPIIFQKFSNLADDKSVRPESKCLYVGCTFYSHFIFFCRYNFHFGKQLILSYQQPGLYYILSTASIVSFWIGSVLHRSDFLLFRNGTKQAKEISFPESFSWNFISSFKFYFINFWGINGVAYSTLLIGLIYLVHISVINLFMLKEIKRPEV